MSKILIDEILPSLKSKVLTNTSGSVKSENVDYEPIKTLHTAILNQELFDSDNASITYRQFGKLVILSIDEFVFKGEFTSGTILASGMPSALSLEVFAISSLGTFSKPSTAMRLNIDSSGNMKIHYSTASPNVIYTGRLVYFCQ